MDELEFEFKLAQLETGTAVHLCMVDQPTARWIAIAPGPAPEAEGPMIFIVVKWTIRPERSSEWLTLVDDFTQGTRASRATSSSSGPRASTTRTSSCW